MSNRNESFSVYSYQSSSLPKTNNQSIMSGVDSKLSNRISKIEIGEILWVFEQLKKLLTAFMPPSIQEQGRILRTMTHSIGRKKQGREFGGLASI